MTLNPYQRRLLKDLETGVQEATRMLGRESDERTTEFMARLPAIRSQLQQATNTASELWGSMSQERFGGR
jgi:hypothetical protein